MSNILLKVENLEAEKLWSYFLAYKRIINKKNQTADNETTNDCVALSVMPTLEQPQSIAKQKRNLKKRTA